MKLGLQLLQMHRQYATGGVAIRREPCNVVLSELALQQQTERDDPEQRLLDFRFRPDAEILCARGTGDFRGLEISWSDLDSCRPKRSGRLPQTRGCVWMEGRRNFDSTEVHDPCPEVHGSDMRPSHTDHD